MSKIEINCKNYTNFQRIGTGTYGNVYKAQNINTGYYVAIKEIDKQKYSTNQILNEIKIMNNIISENSVTMKDKIDTKEYFYIIMDLCQMNLEDYIRTRETSISINEIKHILLQLNNVFKIMNNKNIIYRDLKPNNILISLERLDKLIIKLSDYGCSKEISNTMSIAGTPLTMAPEIINDEKDLSKSDLWSLGIIIYYLYFKEYPYNGKNEHMLFKDINSGKTLKSIENVELNDLMNKLLKINIKERLSWDEYFNHSFFKNNDKNEIITELKEKIKLLENELKNIKNEKKEKDLNNIFNLELKNPLNTLNNHKDVVYCLTLLNDGRLVSGSRDKSIIIYNKQNYKPDIIIKEHKDSINFLIQLKNGLLSSCSVDKSIMLFNIKENKYEIIQILNLHSKSVNIILELFNNSFVSGSDDKTIIFYYKDNIKYKKDYSISTSDLVNNIIQTKKNEIVYSTYDNKINFFDLNKRINISTIENISFSINSFCMITNNLLLVPGRNMISIINVNEYKKIKQIDIDNVGYIIGVCMLNSNLIITGGKILMEWKVEKDNLILISKKEQVDNHYITVILNLNNNHIATASYDKTINIW